MSVLSFLSLRGHFCFFILTSEFCFLNSILFERYRLGFSFLYYILIWLLVSLFFTRYEILNTCYEFSNTPLLLNFNSYSAFLYYTLYTTKYYFSSPSGILSSAFVSISLCSGSFSFSPSTSPLKTVKMISFSG